MTSPLLHVAPVSPTLAVGVREMLSPHALATRPMNPAFALESAVEDPDSEAMAILADGRVAGFYRIDHAPSRTLGVPLPRGPLLGSLLLDGQLHAQALHARVLGIIAADLQRRHPDIRLLLMVAHCHQRALLQAVHGCGFLQTGLFLPPDRDGARLLLQRYLPRPGERHVRPA